MEKGPPGFGDSFSEQNVSGAIKLHSNSLLLGHKFCTLVYQSDTYFEKRQTLQSTLKIISLPGLQL